MKDMPVRWATLLVVATTLAASLPTWIVLENVLPIIELSFRVAVVLFVAIVVGWALLGGIVAILSLISAQLMRFTIGLWAPRPSYQEAITTALVIAVTIAFWSFLSSVTREALPMRTDASPLDNGIRTALPRLAWLLSIAAAARLCVDRLRVRSIFVALLALTVMSIALLPLEFVLFVLFGHFVEAFRGVSTTVLRVVIAFGRP
ncbi:MAG: hypothetical protein AAFV62_04350 [Pseudomonadota bacterium]